MFWVALDALKRELAVVLGRAEPVAARAAPSSTKARPFDGCKIDTAPTWLSELVATMG